MSPEAQEIYAKLAAAQQQLDEAKRDLEQVRKIGEEAQRVVNACRAEVHQLKDQLAALAASEAPTNG